MSNKKNDPATSAPQTAPASAPHFALASAPQTAPASAPQTAPGVTAAQIASAAASGADPFAMFQTARVVTMQLLKQGENEAVAIFFASNIYRGRELKSARGGVERESPADIANVLNLVTGELQSYICATVLKSELTENYPDNSYVGKCFVIERGAKKVGGARSYNTYKVREIVAPSGMTFPAIETIADKSAPKKEAPKA
jgi:hypothetical protein